MHEWLIRFKGECAVDANTPEEAIAKLRELNPHNGNIYDDRLDILLIQCMDDE